MKINVTLSPFSAVLSKLIDFTIARGRVAFSFVKLTAQPLPTAGDDVATEDTTGEANKEAGFDEITRACSTNKIIDK